MLKIIFGFVLLSISIAGYSQVVISDQSNPSPDASAGLDVNFPDKGFLPPRLSTADRMTISNPAPGLLIFNTDLNCMEYYNGSGWFSMCGSSSCNVAPASPVSSGHAPNASEIEWNWTSVSEAIGYKWSTSNDYGNATDIGTSTTYTQSGLACGTPHVLYVWSYNLCGESAPLTLNASTTTCFVCGTNATDINGNVYGTAQINDECWFTSNLKTTQYSNGDAIPNETNATLWAALTSGAWAYYNNNGSNNTDYGKLYNFYAVTDSRGLCPTGFHVPTDTEWTNLTTFLGGESVAGGKLKSVGTSFWNSPNTGATNQVGFNGYAGGIFYFDGANPAVFANMGFGGYFWSSSTGAPNTGWRRRMGYDTTEAHRDNYHERNGMSVRCVLD